MDRVRGGQLRRGRVATHSSASTISIISADGVRRGEINNLVWGWTPDFGTSNLVWSPDSRRLAFIDDQVYTAGEVFLETAKISGTDYQQLRRGLAEYPGRACLAGIFPEGKSEMDAAFALNSA